jgi:hypothetical protein
LSWGEAPVVTGPGDERPGTARQGRLRAAHADREGVVEVLKAAFVQGRLDKGELDTRVGRALASRTYAELAVLTADIPAEPAQRHPARGQSGTSRKHPVRNGAIAVGVSLIVAAAAVLGAFILDGRTSAMLFGLAVIIVLMAVPLITLVTALHAWDERRSRRQLPPRSGPGRQVPQDQRHGQARHGPALPRDRPDQARSDLRSDRPQPGRPHSSGRGARAPRGVRPAPGAA